MTENSPAEVKVSVRVDNTQMIRTGNTIKRFATFWEHIYKSGKCSYKYEY